MRKRGKKVERISQPVVKRMIMYYRCLSRLKENNVKKVSSQDLGEIMGLKPSQIRKDLSYFGEFGKRGYGYSVEKLLFQIKSILGMDKIWNGVIIGLGNLGFALANYPGFLEERNIRLVGAFDIDEKKIGKKVNERLMIMHNDELENFVKKERVDFAILTVPAEAAQDVADYAVKCGIKGILNFAPILIRVPDDVILENVDFLVSLKALIFNMVLAFEK